MVPKSNIITILNLSRRRIYHITENWIPDQIMISPFLRVIEHTLQLRQKLKLSKYHPSNLKNNDVNIKDK